MHGLFEWVDVSVPDLQQAFSFYGGVFGWEPDAVPEGNEGDYVQFMKDGKTAAGLVVSSGPPSWNSYVTVDDVAAIRDRAAGLGATVVMERDLGETGKIVFIQDPQGAGLGFWERGAHPGSEVFNVPGFLTWNEVRTRDVEASWEFYAGLMPEWSFEDQGPEGNPYVMVSLGDRLNAAIALMGPHFAPDTPVHWAVWFVVDDAAASMEKVEKLGGASLGPVVDTSYGPATRVADPFGTPFFIIGPMVVPADG